MKRKYGALRGFATFYKIIGILVAVVGVVAGVLSFASSYIGAAATGLTTIIGGIIAGSAFIAFSELIELFIDLEENTRATREAMQRMTQRRKSG